MSLHTRQTSGRGRRIVVFGVSLPLIPVVLTVLGAGVALAAILLTTTITGQTTIKSNRQLIVSGVGGWWAWPASGRGGEPD